jgi:hypothetical protein
MEYPLKLSEAELGRYQFMAETAAQSEADLWAAAGVAVGAEVADSGVARVPCPPSWHAWSDPPDRSGRWIVTPM